MECLDPLTLGVHGAQMALSLSPHCLSVPEELSQRDAHQEDRNPVVDGPGGAWDLRKEESSSSAGQSSLGAWEEAGPEHLGREPWGVVELVVLAQLPWSQVVVVTGVPEQVGLSPVGAAATAAAAAVSGAAPAVASGIEEAMTSDIWGNPNPG